jgi:drug/metabolite transporter (DMT)-like permease
MVTLALIAVVSRGAIGKVATTVAPRFQLARGFIATLSMGIGFFAVANLPLADSNALGFSEVLYTTLGAALVLKETVGWRRWLATSVGLVGVFVMLSPFGSGVSIYTLMAVIAPAFGAATSIMVRMKAGAESTQTLLFWNALVSFVMMAPVAALLWTTPGPADAGAIVVISVLGYVAQWSYTRAYQIGQAAALAPMHFTRLLIAGVAGWIVFGEVPTVATVGGAVLVVAATVYTLKRNAVRGVPVDPQGGPAR